MMNGSGGVARTSRTSRRRYARRGLLLVVVLMIISVLGLLAASFSYRMNADFAAVKAAQDQQQATLAAKAGIDCAIELLRDWRVDQDSWYNNYVRFRRVPVYLPGKRDLEDGKGGSLALLDKEKTEGQEVWRFSLVGYIRNDQQEEQTRMRYGLTDEAGKVNLNVASRSQLLALFDRVRHDGVSSEQLADALIDWRDRDDEESMYGAESRYYLTLHPAYRARNAPLTSVEELLMIKGFNGRILYGEDYNRNGYLDPNEDDGEEEGTFPPDNGDGALNQGLLPFVTVHSWDWNRSNDNKVRVDINTMRFDQISSGAGGTGGTGGAGGPGGAGGRDQRGGAGGPGGMGGAGGLAALGQKIPAHITEELRPEVIDFIAECQKLGYRFRSIGDLVGLEVYKDRTGRVRSNHDAMWYRYAREFRRAEARVEEQSQDQNTDADQNADADPDADEDHNRDEAGGPENRGPGNESTGRDGNDDLRGGTDRDARAPDRRDDRSNDARGPGERDEEDETGDSEDKGDDRRQQSIRDDRPENNAPGAGRDGDDNRRGEGGRRGGPPGGRDRGERRGPGGGGFGRGGPGGGFGRGPEGRNNQPGGGPESGPDQSTPPIKSPVEASDLPVLLDRLTVWNSPIIAGLINVNTAPPRVLRTIPGLTDEEVQSIVEKRQSLEGPERLTPAWLVSSGAITPEKFALISNLLTTRSIQFTIDSIGFADHVGAVKRFQAIVEMRGQLARIKYFRDITSLGVGYPVWDDERSEGLAFADR